MGIGDIFMILKRQYKSEDFKEINETIYLNEISTHFNEYKNCKFNEFKEDLLNQNININNLRIGKILYPVIVFTDGFISISHVLMYDMPLVKTIERLNKWVEHLYNLWNNKDYSSFFQVYDNKFVYDFFIDNYKSMPKEEAKKIFKYIHCKNEGYVSIDKKIVNEILDYGEYSDDLYINSICDNDGYVNIYRGQGEKSVNIKEAFSWTTSLAVAFKFAFKFNINNTYIYTGKVHKSKILYFTNYLNEREIVVNYNDIINIEEFNKYSLINEKTINGIINLDDLTESYCIYKVLINKFDGYFNLKESIHGILHSKRVLFLALTLSELFKLSNVDRRILAMCSILHDLRRIDDGIDIEHGFRAVQFIEETPEIYNLLQDMFDEEEINIVKEIIRFHPIDDEEGIESINCNEYILDKDRAVNLFKCFKDCDNIDRIRLGDLDENYLRFDESKKTIGIAYELLHNLE